MTPNDRERHVHVRWSALLDIMAKYTKKRITVEAFQWFPHMGEVGGVVFWPPGEPGRKPTIETLEGRHEVSKGDWIITGIKGEKYPCKPDIFAATYDVANDVS